jgi:hypothetical protein
MAEQKEAAKPAAPKPAAAAPAAAGKEKGTDSARYAYQRVLVDYLASQGIVPSVASKGTIVLKKHYELMLKEGTAQFDKFFAFAEKSGHVDISFTSRA